MKPQTLMVAILCVASKIKHLDEMLEAGNIEDEAEAELLLVSYDLALAELKLSYEIALDNYTHMPKYEILLEKI